MISTTSTTPWFGKTTFYFSLQHYVHYVLITIENKFILIPTIRSLRDTFSGSINFTGYSNFTVRNFSGVLNAIFSSRNSVFNKIRTCHSNFTISDFSGDLHALLPWKETGKIILHITAEDIYKLMNMWYKWKHTEKVMWRKFRVGTESKFEWVVSDNSLDLS